MKEHIKTILSFISASAIVALIIRIISPNWIFIANIGLAIAPLVLLVASVYFAGKAIDGPARVNIQKGQIEEDDYFYFG